jgi:hypothetical protein
MFAAGQKSSRDDDTDGKSLPKAAQIAREVYFAILLVRATAAPLIVASTEGGGEIARKNYSRIDRPASRSSAVSNPQTGEATSV